MLLLDASTFISFAIASAFAKTIKIATKNSRINSFILHPRRRQFMLRRIVSFISPTFKFLRKQKPCGF